jgi:hypothetical protein
VARLTSQMLVSALVRRVDGAGGFAMIIQKGDPIGGVIMIQAMEKGQFRGFFERMTDLSGKTLKNQTILRGVASPIRTSGLSSWMSQRQNGSPLRRSVTIDLRTLARQRPLTFAKVVSIVMGTTALQTRRRGADRASL